MSANIEREIRKFEENISEALKRAHDCVEIFIQSGQGDTQFLMAERLVYLGSAIIPRLQAIILDEARDGDSRYLAAWVAVRLGDRGDCVDLLINEVEKGGKWAVPAASALGRQGIQEGLAPILRALDGLGSPDTSSALVYLNALRDLDAILPARVKQKLLTEFPSWVGRVVESDFPEE